MSEFKSEMVASECMETNMHDYGDYTIDSKFPNVLDGLKPIHRRIIYCLHKNPGIQKEASLTGDVMKVHPHGDASISDAISTLCQPFTHIVPLVFSNSNIGTYSGNPPAAARYVDVGEAEVAKALFFTDINPAMLKMIRCETEKGLEPANFIPPIPTSMLIPVFGIALGFQTKTVVCSAVELCKLTKEYIALRSKELNWSDKLKPLSKYMLPDFPTECTMRNSVELLDSYKKGIFDLPILLDGKMHVYHDKIVIETLPPSKTFHSITMDVGKRTKIKGSFEDKFFQRMEDLPGRKAGIMRGAFECDLRRGINPFDVLSQLKKNTEFTFLWRPDRRYVEHVKDVQIMSLETPLTLLDKWYRARYDAVLGSLKQTLKGMVFDQRKLMALIIVVDHTDEVYKIFKNAKSPEETIVPLCKRFALSRMQAEYLASLKFSDITAHGKDELLQKLEKVRADMVELQKKFGLINETMIESVDKFENKFAKDFPRHCIIPKYIGAACYKKTGWIMIEKEEELDEIIQDFNGPNDIDIHMFYDKGRAVAIGSDEDSIGDVPKYLKALYVGKVDGKPYTACLAHKSGVSIIEGAVVKSNEMIKETVPISERFVAVTKQGIVSHERVSSKWIRKNVNAGPTNKDVVFVANDIERNDVIVIHGSSSQPNMLVIERTNGNDYKLHRIVVGEWRVLAVIDPKNSGNRVYVNIPQDLRSRCLVRHIAFDNIGSLIKPGEKLTCVYGKSSLSSDFSVAPLRRKSTILLAKKNH